MSSSILKKLISESDLSAATHLSEDSPLLALISSISGIEKVNKLYDSLRPYQDLDFVNKLFEFLEIEVEFDPKELERIPKSGPFIIVANHPFGAIDGMMLIKVVAPLRPDFKVMANFLLQHVEPIKDYFLAVNPFDDKKTAYSNIAGLKKSMAHVADGHALGIFPAGEVSSFQMDTRSIADKKWQSSALKIVKKAQVPVVPIYFDGSNSRLFHLLGLVHPSLRTLTLPQELMRKRGKKVKLRIGNPISAADQADFSSVDQYGRFIRAKTYALGSSFEVKKDYFKLFQTNKKPDPIAEPIDDDIIRKEIENIESYLLHSHEPFDCYLAPSGKIPKIIEEIGRLREITFREIGEGTNKARDLDEYDIYYHHLILWDKSENKIAGAYRIGMGKDIIARFGRKGFYLSSLFKLGKELNPILKQSVELGRSFIPKEYQQKRLPLFLLWKGILTCLFTRPEYRYMIGPVSISSSYQEISRGLIIEFVRKHYFNHDLAQYVKPRNEFKVKSSNVDKEALLSATSNDLKTLDKLISDIEPRSYTIPVLLKKYLHQNARIIGFNCDPLFNNALDGLMILDFKDIPQDTLDNLSKEFKSS